jgi:hypothetical protein
METNRQISPIIYAALDMMRKCFGGTEVKLLSEKMYRLKPDENAKAGRLGVDIEVMGIKTFFGCESDAEYMLIYGQPIADEFVAMLIKSTYPEKFE